MLRLTILVFLLAAPAAQAAFVERPFEPMPDRAVATCLRATGAPGELALFGPFTKHRSATDLLTAGPDATTRTARVQIGPLFDCAATATAAGGAAVVAGAVAGTERTEMRAVARDPGGRFGPHAELGGADLSASVVAAVAPAGHAVVAWAQRRGQASDENPQRRIVAVRRLPAGAFGRLETLTPWRRGGEFGSPGIAVAMDATAVATVAWVLPTRDRRRFQGLSAVEAARAAPGASFAVQRVATAAQDVSRPALSVAPDGWALLSYDESSAIHVLERPPGAAGFTEVFSDLPPEGAPSDADMPVVAVRDGGGGVVAWRSSSDDAYAGVAATVRSGAGPFALPRTVASDTPRPNGNVLGFLAVGIGGSPLDNHNGALRAALAPDGRALLAWTALRGGLAATNAAAGTLTAGFGGAVRLGSPVREANGVAPLFLPDGRAAVAWTDNASRFGYGIATDHGRLHLAVESGPAAPEQAAPRVRLTAKRVQRLFGSQSVRVLVACDRPCDVHAVAFGRGGPVSALTRSVASAGTMRLSLSANDDITRPPHERRVRVQVRASAPGGHEVTTASVRVRVVNRPPLPVPAPLDVRAVRQGRSILVSWHTASRARRAVYGVTGQRGRRLTRADFRDTSQIGHVEGRGRTRFSVRLRPRDPAAVHWVAVQGASRDSHRATRRVLVPVTR